MYVGIRPLPVRVADSSNRSDRPWSESIFDTLTGQLDLKRHGGRTLAGVVVRVGQRLLALTAAIWHNDTIGAPIKRSLTAYGH